LQDTLSAKAPEDRRTPGRWRVRHAYTHRGAYLRTTVYLAVVNGR